MRFTSGGVHVSAWWALCVVCAGWAAKPVSAGELAAMGQDAEPPPISNSGGTAPNNASGIWRRGVGSGLRTGVGTWGLNLAAGLGVKTLGSREKHDLVGGSVHYGRSLGPNWMLSGELFGAAQTGPRSEYVLGLSPILQYQFRTDTRWVPFAEAGVGLAYTSIRKPDLSTGFEFILQGGIGTHYFYADDSAITLRYRWLHLSNGGIDSPNRGTNTQMLFLGWSRFY